VRPLQEVAYRRDQQWRSFSRATRYEIGARREIAGSLRSGRLLSVLGWPPEPPADNPHTINGITNRSEAGALEPDGLRVIAEGMKPDDRVAIGGVKLQKEGTLVNPKLSEVPGKTT